MTQLFFDHLNIFIGALSGLIVAITGLVVALNKIKIEREKIENERINLENERIKIEAEKKQKEEEEKKQKEESEKMDWEKLKSHTIFSTLSGYIHFAITSNDIASDVKRDMVQKSLSIRMRGWFNVFMSLITHEGLTAEGYIFSDGKTLADFFYTTIKEIHIEQLKHFPKSYVEKYYEKYVSKVGQKTSEGVGEIFDNHNGIYKNDIEKMWAILTLIKDTLEVLYIIGIETANEMNGELEEELRRRNENRERFEDNI